MPQESACIEFNAAACVADGNTLAGKVCDGCDAAFLGSNDLADFGVKGCDCGEVLYLGACEEVCAGVSVVHNVVLNDSHVSFAYLDKLNVCLGRACGLNVKLYAGLVLKNLTHCHAVAVIRTCVASGCENDLFVVLVSAGCEKYSCSCEKCENKRNTLFHDFSSKV